MLDIQTKVCNDNETQTEITKTTIWKYRLISYILKDKHLVEKLNSKTVQKKIIEFDKEFDKPIDDFEQYCINCTKYTNTKLKKLEMVEEEETTIQKNINKMGEIFELSKTHKTILEFIIALDSNSDSIADFVDICKYNDAKKFSNLSAYLLKLPLNQCEEVFFDKSKISTLIKITTKRGELKFEEKNNLLFHTIAGETFDESNILNIQITSPIKSTQNRLDYGYIKEDIDMVTSYLKTSIKNKTKSINVLIYGDDKSGKTTLAKYIISKLKVKTFEIATEDADYNELDEFERIGAYTLVQGLASTNKNIVFVDDSDDMFEPVYHGRRRNNDKLSTIANNNNIPTIWVINDIDELEKGELDKFNLSIEMKPIPEDKKIKIIKKSTHNLLDKNCINQMIKNSVSLDLISSSSDMALTLGKDTFQKNFLYMLNNKLKLQNNKLLNENTKELETIYDVNYINSDTDVKNLVNGIVKTKNAKLCLYGRPGTGKSAFGKHIAKELDKTCLIKKASDIFSKWVGGSEKNIAKAFKEAKDKDAVLIFDEVDSFLQDRKKAKQSFEATQVNEFLVQMENFEGVFIATTNLMNNLDEASLRRFDLKVKFDYLSEKQVLSMFNAHLKNMKLKPNKMIKDKLKTLKTLASGDFASVTRQHKFRPIEDSKDFFNRLKVEINIKEQNTEDNLMSEIGFR